MTDKGGGARAVVVTGGGSGIGRCTARRFADAGAGVLVVGRTEADLAETAEGYDTIRVLPVDITEPGAPAKVVDAALNAFGRIDVLVNNAGAPGYGALEGLNRAGVATQFDTNVLAPIFLTQRALEALSTSRGTVVNVSSSGSLGRRAWPENSVYGASKVALDFLTRSWAVELAPRGIRVVAVAPGVVETGIGERMGMSSEQYQGFLENMSGQVPAGRVGRPEDVAWWIVQLAAPEAGYTTGTVLAVDGGLSLT